MAGSNPRPLLTFGPPVQTATNGLTNASSSRPQPAIMSNNESHGHSRKRSNSQSRTSRPTTPLRPSSRSSFRESARGAHGEASFPLNAFEPAFAELSDAMVDLEANMMHFQLMHESLARFSESFASFLYGLNMNAFCVDFPEVGPLLPIFNIS